MRRVRLAFAAAGGSVSATAGVVRDQLSWERIGAALFSERSLRALLYLGAALVVAATLTLTVTSFRSNAPWQAQQAILLFGGLNFLISGWYVRERLRLRLSGGILLDLGALWIPLNVGVAAYQQLRWDGGPYVIGIPLDAPQAFLAIAALTVPAYALLVYRFRLILPLYGAAIVAGVGIASATHLLGASWEWQIAAAAVLAPVIALLARNPRGVLTSELATHAFWLSHGWAPAVLLVLIAVPLDEQRTLAPLALTGPAWLATITAAYNSRGRTDPLHRYLPLLAAALALVLTLRAIEALPPHWYGVFLAALAHGYLIAAPRLPGFAATADRAARRTLAERLRQLEPAEIVAGGLSVAALAFVWMPESAAATLLVVAGFHLAAGRRFGFAPLEYTAALLLTATVVAATEASGLIAAEWDGVVVATIAASYVLASRGRAGWLLAPGRARNEGMTRLDTFQSFGSLGGVGLALTVLALVAEQSVESAAVAYGIVVATYVAAAQLYRRAIFEYAAAALLPLAVVFGLEATAVLEREWYGVVIAALAAGYVLASRGLARSLLAPGHARGEGMTPPDTFRSFGSLGGVGLALTVLALGSALTIESAPAAQGIVVATYLAAARLYRRAIFEYAAAALLPVALVLGLEATALLEREWYGVALLALAGGYLAAGRFAGRWLLAPSWRTPRDADLLEAIRSLGSFGAIAQPLVVAALALYPLQDPASAAATQLAAAAVLATSALLQRRIEFEYAAAIVFPIEALHLASSAGLRLAVSDVLLASIGLAYVAGARALRYRRAPSAAAGWLAYPGPYYLGGVALAIAAAAWTPAELGSRALALYIATATVGSTALIFRARWLAYAAAALLFAPFALTLARFEVGPHQRSLALLGFAVVELAAAEGMLRHPRIGGARLTLRGMLLGLAPARPLFASPLYLAGSVALLATLALATFDTFEAPESALSPWAFAGVAAVLAVAAAARRSTLLAHAAAWTVLPAFVLLGTHGFYVADEATPIAQLRNIALLAAGFFALGVALDRFARRYAGAALLPAYLLLPAAMLGTTPDRGLNVAVVGGSALVYGVAAVLVHFDRQRWFAGTLERVLSARPASLRAHTRNVFLYLTTLLAAVAALLALSLREPPPEHYGYALVALATLYLATGRLSRRIDLTYRHAWYLPGYAMSVAGPLTATAGIDAFLVAFGVTILLYAASAVISRHVAWTYAVVLLAPLWGLVALARFETPLEYYGPAAIALAFAYTVVGAAVQTGPHRVLRQPFAGAIRSQALPFLVAGFALAAFGLGHAVGQDRPLAAAALATGALYCALVFQLFRQTLFVWGVVAFAAAAYALAVPILGFVPSGYEGVALAPGIAVAMLLAELIRRRERPARGPAAGLFGSRLDRIDSRALPFAAAVLGAAVAAVAAPIWSSGEAWALTAGLAIAALTQLHFSTVYRGPLWLLPALALGDVVYVRALIDGGVVDSPTWAAVALVLPVVASAAVAEFLWEREGRPRAVLALPPAWSHPLHAHAAVLLAGSLALASFEASTGLVAALAYAGLLAAGALRRRSEPLAWATLALALVAGLQAERWLGVPAVQIAGIVARARRGEALRIWVRPLQAGSGVGAAVALGLSLAFWAADGSSNEQLQPLTMTIAVTALTVIATAYSIRSVLLSYAGVALLLTAYMLQLARFEVAQPLLFAIPAGLYLLGVSFFERRRGVEALVPPLQWAALLLLLGVPLLLGTGLATSEFAPEWNRRVLFGLGLASIAGGVALQWKRPFFAGIAAFLANLLLLLTEPEGSVVSGSPSEAWAS